MGAKSCPRLVRCAGDPGDTSPVYTHLTMHQFVTPFNPLSFMWIRSGESTVGTRNKLARSGDCAHSLEGFNTCVYKISQSQSIVQRGHEIIIINIMVFLSE